MISEAAEDEAEIIAGLQGSADQRREAITALFTQYNQRFRKFFERRGLSRSDAEDLCQDTFIRIAKAAQSADVREPRAWLWQVARSALIDQFRRQPPPTESVDALDSHVANTPDPSQSSGLEDCVRRQFQAFAELDPQGAQVLAWATVEQFTAVEIGAMIDRTPGATREFLSQLRKKVREYLGVCREFLQP